MPEFFVLISIILLQKVIPVLIDMSTLQIFSRLVKDENCNIQYDDLMTFLDFQTRPVYNLTDADYEKVVRHAPPVKDTEVSVVHLLCKAHFFWLYSIASVFLAHFALTPPKVVILFYFIFLNQLTDN